MAKQSEKGKEEILSKVSETFCLFFSLTTHTNKTFLRNLKEEKKMLI